MLIPKILHPVSIIQKMALSLHLFLSTTAALLLCGAAVAQNAPSNPVAEIVSATEKSGVYVVRKIPLQNAVMPEVEIADRTYETAAPREADSVDLPIKTLLGNDRKKPFLLVAVPVRKAGGTQALHSFTVIVKEKKPVFPENLSKKAAATASPLATGSWYKIAVEKAGFYKIDHNFLRNTLKISGNISSASLRLLGNGGAMMQEANAPTTGALLPENSLWVQDGGDGTIDAGDYIVFWAPGPQSWDADTAAKRFYHRKHLYEDKSYYFLSLEGGATKVIPLISNAPTTTNVAVNAYDCRNVIDDDVTNLGKIGKRWVGDEFTSGSKTYSFDYSNLLSPLQVRVNLAARNNGGTERFQITLNGMPVGNAALNLAADPGDLPCQSSLLDQQITTGSGPAAVTIGFMPFKTGSRGYLDFVEVVGRRSLIFSGGTFSFRDIESVGPGNKARFTVQNAPSNLQVWDVTEPWNAVRMAGTFQSGSYVFNNDAGRLREYAAFDGSNYNTPTYAGQTDNQNIVGAPDADYLIVTHKNFLKEANRLADWHRTQHHYRVHVATTEQIYNEFSSGSQDIGGIRDYARYFYDRAGSDTTNMPRFLLLFGDASYDYKDRVGSNTNFVPVFESSESNAVLAAYTTDDYFGFLDAGEDAEGVNIYNVLDIGVGRLPVKTTDEARQVVDKIIYYKSPATLGPWRVSGTLMADQEDGAGPHLANTEDVSALVADVSPVFNQNKIYLDSYPVVSTPAGDRMPDVNAQINNQVYKGTQFINYAGHGGIRELAQERVLTFDDFNRWKNLDKLPFMVTATCDFAQYDRPDFVSAGEALMLKPDGGMIALLTTTQAVYAYSSRILNNNYIEEQFKQDNGIWTPFGEAIRKAKNATYISKLQTFGIGGSWSDLLNYRKFALLGDPGLSPNLPAKLNAVQTDSIVEVATGRRADSIAALGNYVLTGSVTNGNGVKDISFNGRVYVVVYDKARHITVKLQKQFFNREYETRSNIVFKGRANVVNGQFSMPFVAPKDLNYALGNGQVQYYAEDGVTDVAGVDTTIQVGGSSRFPVIDDQPPVVRAFIGDSLFHDGGLTGSNTVLYGVLEDETGINVSGNSIGHDLIAVLDGQESEPYVLNDYYENAPNTYKKGFVRFPVSGLSNGMHTLKIKGWDMANNSGEGSIRFRVSDGSVTEIQEVINYPNPFKDQTRFRFEHNHPDETLTGEVQIYNTAGELVRTLRQTFTPTGSHSTEMTWDGSSDVGALLPSGVYIYRITISTAKKSEALGYQKLVIAR